MGFSNIKHFSGRSSRAAFTLIEVIIYVIIVSFIIVGSTNFVHAVIGSSAKATAQKEIVYHGRFVLQQILAKMREAEDVILAGSTFDSNQGVLVLDMPGNNPDVIFETYFDTVLKLRMKDGTAIYDLTTGRLKVDQFIVRNFTAGAGPKVIRFEFALSRVNTSGDPDFDAAISLNTAVTIRR